MGKYGGEVWWGSVVRMYGRPVKRKFLKRAIFFQNKNFFKGRELQPILICNKKFK